MPLPMAWGIMVTIIALCMFVWRMDARVERLVERYDEREKFDKQRAADREKSDMTLQIEREKNAEMLKKYLEDQITIAGLRNAAVAAYSQKGR